MAGSGVRSRYHIAINQKGFMLRGAPGAPSYVKQDAPTLLALRRTFGQLGIEDFSADDLSGSGWAFFKQTDWAGGFQQIKYQDDGSFRDGQGVDPIKEYGNISLQNNFTSAVQISASHNYGAHEVVDGSLILGSVKSGAAKLFKITSGNTLSILSALAGISAVNSISRFASDALIGMTRTSGVSAKTLAVLRNGAISGFRNANPKVRAVRGIGIRAYISEYINATSADMLSYATNLSAFTSAYNAGKNRKISNIRDLNGVPYFFVEDGRKVQMFRYDEINAKALPIYTFDDLTSWGVTVNPYISLMVIAGTTTNQNKRIAYAFNGARLWQIFDDQLRDTSYDFSKPFEYNGNLHFKGAQWDGQYFFPGLYGKFKGVQYTPFVNFAQKAYGFALSGNLTLAYLDQTKYQISGNVVGSSFGHSIGGIDKLVNSVTVNTKALAANQMIEILRSTDEGASFTSVGKMQFTGDGAATSKVMYFPSGFVTKLWNYKAVLVGPGTTTPTILDITHQYRPIPDTKQRWTVSIDAGDQIYLLNNQQEQRDGKALVSELWIEKEAKRTVLYEDVDAMSAKIMSAMTSAATSARVNNTRFFPPKGRIRVVSGGVVEEMTYTSADGGQIKGITRGVKGTKPRAYSAGNYTFDNYYNVIVTNLTQQINDTDQNRTESIARVTLLEV